MGLFSKKTTQAVVVPPALPVRISDFADSLEGRADAAIATLSTLAQAGDIGRPFGPGFGLEQARGWLLQILPNQSELQAFGHVAGDTLIEGLRSKRIDFDSIDEVLGIDGVGARKFGLSRRQEAVNISAIESSKDVLVTMSREDISGLKKWLSDMPFMAEVLAYHQLAILRLKAAGRLD